VETTYGINSVISKLMTFVENIETGQFLFLIMLILSSFTCSCAEIEQISPNIIERSVQSVGECQIVGGGQIQHLRYILLLTLDVCLFLFEVS
jgi:hypothetical protein